MQATRIKKYNLLRAQSTATFLVGKTNVGVPYHKRKARCMKALVDAGKENMVFVSRWQVTAKGRPKLSKSRLTKFNELTQQTHTWDELQRRWYTPWGERIRFKSIKADLLHFCATHRRVYTGVASFGLPCGLRDYRRVAQNAMPMVRKFVAKLRERGHQVSLIYSVIEHTTRDDLGKLRHGPDGKLLYFIHVHFLLWSEDGQDLTKASWLGAFRKKFKGDIERIRSKKKLVHYLTKPMEVVDLLNAGEYVAWVEEVEGLSRYTLYKPVKECAAKRAKLGHKACLNSAGLPYIRKVRRREPRAGRSKAAGAWPSP